MSLILILIFLVSCKPTNDGNDNIMPSPPEVEPLAEEISLPSEVTPSEETPEEKASTTPETITSTEPPPAETPVETAPVPQLK